MKKKSLTVLLIILITLIIPGCAKKTEDSSLVKYENGCGLSIMMPEGMIEEPLEGYVMFYCSDYYTVATIKEEFELLECYDIANSDTTLEEYANILKQNNDVTFEKDKLGNYVAYYSTDYDNTNSACLTTIRKGSSAFYIITFSCLESDKLLYIKQFEDWEKTIEVK